MLQRAARTELGLPRSQPTPGRRADDTRCRSRRREGRRAAAQLHVHTARDRRHDRVLQPLLGLAQLRGPARVDDRRQQTEKGHLGFAAAPGSDAIRAGHLPARSDTDHQQQSTKSISRHGGIADLHGIGRHHNADHPVAGLGQRRRQLDQCARGDQSHLDRRPTEHIRKRVEGQGHLHQLPGVRRHPTQRRSRSLHRRPTSYCRRTPPRCRALSTSMRSPHRA